MAEKYTERNYVWQLPGPAIKRVETLLILWGTTRHQRDIALDSRVGDLEEMFNRALVGEALRYANTQQ